MFWGLGRSPSYKRFGIASEWWFEGAKPRRSVNEAIFQTIGVLKLTEMFCWRPAARAHSRFAASHHTTAIHVSVEVFLDAAVPHKSAEGRYNHCKTAQAVAKVRQPKVKLGNLQKRSCLSTRKRRLTRGLRVGRAGRPRRRSARGVMRPRECSPPRSPHATIYCAHPSPIDASYTTPKKYFGGAIAQREQNLLQYKWRRRKPESPAGGKVSADGEEQSSPLLFNCRNLRQIFNERN